MDLVRLLPEFLDVGVDDAEMEEIAMAALQSQIKLLKVAIANAVVNARGHTLIDNLGGAEKALAEARRLQTQYHAFLSELERMESGTPIRATNGAVH